MRQIFLILTLWTITVAKVSAQGYGWNAGPRKQSWKAYADTLSTESIAQKLTEKMAADLALTEEQKKKIYEINLNAAKQQKALRESTQQQQLEQKEKMKANQEARKREIENVLTPEQNALWKEKRTEHQQQFQQRKELWERKRGER